MSEAANDGQNRSARPKTNPKSKTKSRLDLEAVAFARGYFVQDGIDEEAEDQARDQPGDDDDGEGLLRVAADAGGHGGGEQAEAGDERGHHDGTKAQQSGFARGFANGAAFEAKFVDVADENDRGLHGNAEQREQAENAGHAEAVCG